jgi:hypothetical protein
VLADIVFGDVPQKIETVPLADVIEIDDRVVRDVGDERKQQRDGKDLDENRSQLLVIDQPIKKRRGNIA